MSGWIGVDLDKTLAHYDEYRGVDHIGAPVPAMLERVQRWLKAGKEVRIMTARVAPAHKDADRAKEAIERWCEEHVGQVLPVTSSKDFQMVSLWDDRCVTVEANTGRRLTPEKDDSEATLNDSDDLEVVSVRRLT